MKDPAASASNEEPNAHAGMESREMVRASMMELRRPSLSEKYPISSAPSMAPMLYRMAIFEIAPPENPCADFKKSGERSWVPCDRQVIAVMSKTRYTRSALCRPRPVRMPPKLASRCFCHAVDSGDINVRSATTAAMKRQPTKTHCHPKRGPPSG